MLLFSSEQNVKLKDMFTRQFFFISFIFATAILEASDISTKRDLFEQAVKNPGSVTEQTLDKAFLNPNNKFTSIEVAQNLGILANPALAMREKKEGHFFGHLSDTLRFRILEKLYAMNLISEKALFTGMHVEGTRLSSSQESLSKLSPALRSLYLHYEFDKDKNKTKLATREALVEGLAINSSEPKAYLMDPRSVKIHASCDIGKKKLVTVTGLAHSEDLIGSDYLPVSYDIVFEDKGLLSLDKSKEECEAKVEELNATLNAIEVDPALVPMQIIMEGYGAETRFIPVQARHYSELPGGCYNEQKQAWSKLKHAIELENSRKGPFYKVILNANNEVDRHKEFSAFAEVAVRCQAKKRNLDLAEEKAKREAQAQWQKRMDSFHRGGPSEEQWNVEYPKMLRERDELQAASSRHLFVHNSDRVYEEMFPRKKLSPTEEASEKLEQEALHYRRTLESDYANGRLKVEERPAFSPQELSKEIQDYNNYLNAMFYIDRKVKDFKASGGKSK
jgi:hypothetical protein